MTHVWNFRALSISGERFELGTTNSACRLITRGTNDKKMKKVGREEVNCDTLEILGPHPHL